MSNWRGRDLDEVLDELVQRASAFIDANTSGGLPPLRLEGNSERDLAAHENRIRRNMPEPVRRLYERADGVIGYSRDRHRMTGSFLKSLVETNWVDCDNYVDLEDLDKDWKRDDYFEFSQSIWADPIFYCENPPGHPPGSIIIVDRQLANRVKSPTMPGQRTPIVFIADSLSDWLARWMALGFQEITSYLGDLKNMAPALRREFLLEHQRLNPSIDWIQERLDSKEWIDLVE